SGATAAELGIVELVSEATTYYLGSTTGRQANIAEAAARFNGIVIGPEQEFSFNAWLGDVSLESGFEESLIIFNGRTIPGVGGGVCQVSTTAFQAAFYAGYPILERYPHGYRVGYYETGEGVGMDATVYSPLVDFRFLNDTPYYLLIETSTNTSASTVTFRFYSTDIGREVVKLGPRVDNIVPHGDPVYEENAELYAGQVRQVEWAVDGADVTVTRQVFRDGQLESEDHFFSHYLPWNAVFQVAPGQIPARATSSTQLAVPVS
ncbi:MAG: VanW family protein, partial [Anaerolineae bacterium]|nr:VanW family protein [Anaerolineae bacterium]